MSVVTGRDLTSSSDQAFTSLSWLAHAPQNGSEEESSIVGQLWLITADDVWNAGAPSDLKTR